MAHTPSPIWSAKLVQMLSGMLHLHRTAKAILVLCAEVREKLSVREIAERLRLSERSVRKHLAPLLSKGLLAREVAVTKAKRLSYRYYLPPIDAVLAKLKREMQNRIATIEKAARSAA
ncbi:MAG: HTH domain-containing protein [Candidatus Thermoplasmatota archaeon]